METRVKYGETTYPANWMDVLASFVGVEPLSGADGGREHRREEVIKWALRLRAAFMMSPSPDRDAAWNEAEDELSKAVDILTAWEPDYDGVPASGDGVPEWEK